MILRPCLAVLLALLAAGCGEARPDPAPAPPPERVRALHGATPALRARLAVRVAGDGREPRSADLHLWLGADGRLRARLVRLEVEVLDLAIAPDGACTAWAARAGLAATGRCDDPDLPLLACLRRLADELADGPLPAGAEPRPGPGVLAWDEDGAAVELAGDGEGHALRKRIAGPAGTLELEYARYRAFDGLQRVGRYVARGGGLELTALLRDLNPLDGLSAASLRVAPPDSARIVPLAVLLEQLDP